jgi:putative heme-binding domain-containing protein
MSPPLAVRVAVLSFFLWCAFASCAWAADPVPSLIKMLQESDDTQFQLDLLRGMSEALVSQRELAMPAGWEAVEQKLGASSNSEMKALAQTLSLKFGSSAARDALRKTLQDRSADLGARRTALQSLLAVKDAELPTILYSLLEEPALRAPALRGLASFDNARTPDAILRVYGKLPANEKRDALSVLTSRPAYARTLLSAIEGETIPAKDVSADLIRQLRNLKSPELNGPMEKIWGAFRETTADKQAEIEKYKRIYRAGGSQPGDAIRGRAVYVRACQQCHVLYDVGGKVGPDITGANRGDLDYLLQNMLDPNAVIPNDYRASSIETKDGRSITGIIKQQDDKSVTVASATETLTVPRADIESIQESQLSMMPEGLLAQLSDQEVRDLIYYLGRVGQVPLMGTPDTANLFFNGKDLTGWHGDESLWSVQNGEIVGRTMTGLKRNEFLKSDMLLSDFRLVCKVKLDPNKENSGIQFRSEEFAGHEMKGYQADIGAGWWGKLYEEQGRAILWDKPGEQFVNREGWNTYEIIAVGSKILTAINGNICVDLDDPQGARQGIIGLQLHSGGPMEIRFKDFQLEINPRLELVTARK